MELILHYIYTGELLPNWCDLDMIVEFTYAAGKYQLEDVLEYLDNKLGSVVGVPKDDTWKRTGAELADLSLKLGLNTASTEIRTNFVKAIQECDSYESFFNGEKRIKLDEE